MTPSELQEHVQAIATSRRIRNKIVVLCEGERTPPETMGRRPSPQTYRRHEHWPDSSFYKKCIPRSWNNERLPCFFNCAGRSTVLKTFEELLLFHQQYPEHSYLDPDRLFALVDVDIKGDALPQEYHIPDTETLHQTLYSGAQLRLNLDPQHRIWVTALVHKEAYFLLPVVQSAFSKHHCEPVYKQRTFDLMAIHQDLVLPLTQTTNGRLTEEQRCFAGSTSQRLSECPSFAGWSTSSCQAFAAAWLQALSQCSNQSLQPWNQLVETMLLVTKAKKVWKEVEPSPQSGWTKGPHAYRDELAAKVADEIARLSPAEHSLAGFFEYLRQFR